MLMKTIHRLGHWGIRWILPHRWKWLVGIVILVALALPGMGKLSMDNSNESFLPEGDQLSEINDQFKKIFGNEEYLIFLVESDEPFSQKTLNYIESLRKDLEDRLPFAKEATALTNIDHIVGAKGRLEINPLLGDSLRLSPDEIEAVKANIEKSHFYKGKMITDDYRASLVAVSLETIPEEVWVKVPPEFLKEGQTHLRPISQEAWPLDKRILAEDIQYLKEDGLMQVTDPRKLTNPALMRIVAEHPLPQGVEMKKSGVPYLDYMGDVMSFQEATRLSIIAALLFAALLLGIFRNLKGLVARMLVLTFTLLFFLSTSLTALERRKPQFLSEPSYLALPLVWSIPGIGSGLMLTGLVGNMADTYLDVYGIAIFGDARGVVAGADDLHLIPETLFLDFMYQGISKAAVKNYEKRGMDTEKNDYQLIELDKVENRRGHITLSFFERRLEFYGGMETQDIRVIRLRDFKGNIISDLDEPYEDSTETAIFGVVIDYTDDRQDPRAGLRINISRWETPADNEKEPNFFVMNYSVSAYIPIGDISTLAFNYFVSDAHVYREGETDTEEVRKELGMNCPPWHKLCLKTEQELVDRFVASRKYGTASELGGDERFRAYPQGRYQGAHLAYFGAELRWNMAEGVTPFDFWIWKDVATGIQTAFFYEIGSVVDKREEQYEILRSSYGVGLRLVSASGYVYRADFATGQEGNAVSIMFYYPW